MVTLSLTELQQLLFRPLDADTVLDPVDRSRFNVWVVSRSLGDKLAESAAGVLVVTHVDANLSILWHPAWYESSLYKRSKMAAQMDHMKTQVSEYDRLLIAITDHTKLSMHSVCGLVNSLGGDVGAAQQLYTLVCEQKTK